MRSVTAACAPERVFAGPLQDCRKRWRLLKAHRSRLRLAGVAFLVQAGEDNPQSVEYAVALLGELVCSTALSQLANEVVPALHHLFCELVPLFVVARERPHFVDMLKHRTDGRRWGAEE